MNNVIGASIAVAILVLAAAIVLPVLRHPELRAAGSGAYEAGGGRFALVRGYWEDDGAIVYRLDTTTGETSWTLGAVTDEGAISSPWRAVGESWVEKTAE